jgi:uncharacterized protein YndB with AHSA1/START domain
VASVRKEVVIAATPAEVWAAVRDWAALHERLVPGFATDTRVEGRDRIVTFFTGAVMTERIITVDDDEQRLVWSIVDGPYEHHNGAVQVVAESDDRTRFVWIADLLPDDAAERTSQMMERAITVIRKTLEGAGAGQHASDD